MLNRMLRKAVQTDPGKAAIVQGGRRLRYDELHALAEAYTAGLRRLSIAAGDCVAVVLPNCPEFVATLFACASVRAVMLPLDPHYSREQLYPFLMDTHAKVVITDSFRVGSLDGAGATVVAFDSLARPLADPMPTSEFLGSALFLYTSGSMDTRKRLCFTQENLFYEAHNFVETMGLTAADNILCTIPLSHSYGMGNCLLDAVYAGATLVMLESDDAPFAGRCQHVIRLIRDEAIRFYPGVPYQFQLLASVPEHLAPDLGGLKLCVSSGDVLPRQTPLRFEMQWARNCRPVSTVRFG
jgi:long-chain acyl-CoA synthetase